MKILKTVYEGKVIEHMIMDLREDSCPVCDTPLKDVSGSWAMFHGEVYSSCCKSPYQIKDYYVDPEKGTKGYDKLFKTLNDKNFWEFKAPSWIKPLREAIERTGIRDVQNEAVYNLARSIRDSDDATTKS